MSDSSARAPDRRCAPRAASIDGEEHSIRIGEALDHEAGRLEAAAQHRPRVAPELCRQHRVVTAQDRHRGDIDDRHAAGDEHPVHLGDCRAFRVIRQQIEDVERRCDVHAGGREGQRRRRGLCDAALAGDARRGQPAPREIEAEGRAVLAEQLEVPSRAASAVEQTRRGSSGDGRGQQRRHESTEATEPEVIALDRARRGEQTVHWCASCALQ